MGYKKFSCAYEALRCLQTFERRAYDGDEFQHYERMRRFLFFEELIRKRDEFQHYERMRANLWGIRSILQGEV